MSRCCLFTPETVAALTRVVAAVVERVSIPVGVNVLRNDARAALSVAAVTGAATQVPFLLGIALIAGLTVAH